MDFTHFGEAAGGVLSVLLGKGVFDRVRRRYSSGDGLVSLDLARHIDERAEHKARSAVNTVVLETSVLRRELAEWKADASGRFDALDQKVEGVKEDVGKIAEDFAYLRGKLDQ